MKARFLGATMLVMSTAAFAEPQQQVTQEVQVRQETLAVEPRQQVTREEPVRQKKVCRTEKITGSLTRVSRICMTQAEWDTLNRRTKEGLDDFVSGASGGCRAPDDINKGTMC